MYTHDPLPEPAVSRQRNFSETCNRCNLVLRAISAFNSATARHLESGAEMALGTRLRNMAYPYDIILIHYHA